MDTAEGGFWELPISTSTEDFPQFGAMPSLEASAQPRSPQEAIEVWRADLDGMVSIGGLWIAAFHPWLSGRPGPWHHFMGFMREIVARDDVWIATLAEVVEHVQQERESGAFSPTAQRLPYFDGPAEEVIEIIGAEEMSGQD